MIKGKQLIEMIINHAHNIIGYFGQFKTAQYIRRYFWWPSMSHDIESYCKPINFEISPSCLCGNRLRGDGGECFGNIHSSICVVRADKIGYMSDIGISEFR